jgi:hypothetical protein
MHRILAAALMACLSAMAFTARAEDFVVIDSSVAALPAGTTVKSGASVEVPAQGRVVLAAPSGQVVTLNGPYKGAPPAAAGGTGSGSSDVLKILPTLFGRADQRQALGVVRATDAAWREGAVKTPNDVLAIDTTDGGEACIYDPGKPVLLHNPSRHGKMTIEPMNGGDKVTVDWPRDTLQLPWPAMLSIADGDAFVFEQAGETAAAIVTVHVLPAKPAASELDRVTQMAEAGCRDQARLLLALIAKSAK